MDLQRRLERLRRERETLGAVNLRAEEEAETLQTEIDTLVAERDDLRLELLLPRLERDALVLERDAAEHQREARGLRGARGPSRTAFGGPFASLIPRRWRSRGWYHDDRCSRVHTRIEGIQYERH